MPIFDLATLLPQAAPSGQRSERHILTTSNAALAIPSWAQGGKGILLVSGTAAGGGMVGLGGFDLGGGGGSGAWCRDFLAFIPSGATTLNAQVGISTAGNTGGATTVTIAGQEFVRLGGGGAGGISGGGTAGRAFLFTGAVLPDLAAIVSDGYSGTTNGRFTGEAPADGVGAGNPYGIGPVRSDTPLSGIGFGWGASGRLTTGSAAAARSGGNGVLLLEFRECL